MTAPSALAGRNILITRPTGQAEELGRRIRAEGGSPFLFPAIEIRPPQDTARLDAILSRLDQYDLAVFISPSAVDSAWKRIREIGTWPENLRAAAVGQGSARALAAQGVQDVIVPPEQSDSEALLALPALQQVAGRRIVIFRGEGGRELLAQTLSARGAQVEYAECYRRARPDADTGPLLLQHAAQPFSAIVVTSRESLANLRDLLGAAWNEFLSVPVFVPHARIAQSARTLGLQELVVAPGGDAGLIQAMIKYFRT